MGASAEDVIHEVGYDILASFDGAHATRDDGATSKRPTPNRAKDHP